MTKFNITENEIARLSVFADYVKRLGAVYPLNEKQLFVVDDIANKLNVYADGKSAAGGNGIAQISIDIESITVDSSVNKTFITEIESLLNLINKIKGDCGISYDDKQIVISEQGSRNKFKATLFVTREQSEIDEITQFVKIQLAAPEFSTPISVKVDKNYKRLSDLANLTKVLNVSDSVSVKADGSRFRFADNLCIVEYHDGQKTAAEDVFVENNLIPLIKDADAVKFSSDKKFIYIDVKKYGIQVIYSPHPPKWSYPSSQDLDGITPESSNQYALEINAGKLYEVIDKFYGVFQSSYWRYSQVKIETKDVGKTNELRLFFDDMASEIEQYLPVKVISKSNEDNFVFQLPTIYLKDLINDLRPDDNSVITMIYNGLPETDPHGAGVVIMNDKMKVVIAKLVD